MNNFTVAVDDNISCIVEADYVSTREDGSIAFYVTDTAHGGHEVIALFNKFNYFARNGDGCKATKKARTTQDITKKLFEVAHENL